MYSFVTELTGSGPKDTGAAGFLSSPIRTAAFSSKKADVGAVRAADSLTVRTTTAFTTSPFLTWPPGSFADGSDDHVAYAGVLALGAASTRMHLISLAPVLSATLRSFLLYHYARLLT